MKKIYDWYYETTPPGKVKKILFARTIEPRYPENDLIPPNTPLRQVYFEKCFVSSEIYSGVKKNHGVILYGDYLKRTLAEQQ